MSSSSDDSTGIWLFLAVVVIVISFFVVRCFGGLGSHYSEGQRVGVVTKISHKGLLIKSWEGAINLGGASADGNGNVVPNSWDFSVQSDEVAHQIESASTDARRVTVKYHQYFMRPLSIDTGYVIDSVEVK